MKYRWDERELVILNAIVNADEAGDPLDLESVASTTGLERTACGRAIRLLIDDEYITGIDVTSLDGGDDWLKIQPLPKAMRTVGVWPADVFDEALRIIEERLAAESDPEQRQGLQKLRGGLIDIGKGTAAGLLTEVLKRGAF